MGLLQYYYDLYRAIFWYAEHMQKFKKTSNLSFTSCCREGKVQLSKLKETPDFLDLFCQIKDGRWQQNFKKILKYIIQCSHLYQLKQKLIIKSKKHLDLIFFGFVAKIIM